MLGMDSETRPTIGYFWDIENCQVPRNANAGAVVSAIRSEFGKGRTEAEFFVACNVTTLSESLRTTLTEIHKAEVDILHVPGTDKNAADKKLKSRIRKFGETYKHNGVVILISGDAGFAQTLGELRDSRHFKVGVVYGSKVSENLVKIASNPPVTLTALLDKHSASHSSTHPVFTGIPLKRNSGNDPDVTEDALKDKVVALYFSAHWCPPCRQFTPVLKDFYEEVSENNPLEIVFVSFDRSAEDMKKYLEEAHGEWLYIPQGDPNIQNLSEKYGVQGIPALIVIKMDGSVANPNGRADVLKGPGQFASWKAACGI